MPHIAIINESTTYSDAEVESIAPALQEQVDRHFAPAYGLDLKTRLTLVKKGHAPPPGAWQLVLADTSDQAGDSGYHEMTKEGQPIVSVFTRTCQDVGQSISACASHELLEMLADPWVQSCQQVADDTAEAFEVCDPVSHDSFGYLIHGVLVSDFVLPAWFLPGSPGPWDHAGHVTAAQQILPGGYIARLKFPGGQWTQQTSPDPHADRTSVHLAALPGGRFARRRMGRGKWRRSLK